MMVLWVNQLSQHTERVSCSSNISTFDQPAAENALFKLLVFWNYMRASWESYRVGYAMTSATCLAFSCSAQLVRLSSRRWAATRKLTAIVLQKIRKLSFSSRNQLNSREDCAYHSGLYLLKDKLNIMAHVWSSNKIFFGFQTEDLTESIGSSSQTSGMSLPQSRASLARICPRS